MTEKRELTEAEYLTARDATLLIVHLANNVDSDLLFEAIQAAEHSETFSVFTDPTLWMQKGGALRQEIAAMRALAKFKASISDAVRRHA